MGELPPKLFFRIGEVAGLVGVEPHVLRYWEREFRSIRPSKSAKGQRVYSRRDVENLLRVRDLLYRDGFTIAGAKKKMQRGAPDATPLSASPAAVASAHAPEAAAAPSVVDAGAGRGEPALERESARVREKLAALRAEVETFLEELSRPVPSVDGPRAR